MAINHNPVGQLHDLAAFLTEEGQLKNGLDELALRAAQVTEAASCSIMLISEGDDDAPRLKLWASTHKLPSAAWLETPARGESIAGRVLELGQALVIADIAQSEFARLARYRNKKLDAGGVGSSFICAPITVEGRIIGVINLCSSSSQPPFSAADLNIVGIMTALIGKSVQVDRMQLLLRSRIAQMAAAKAEKQVAEHLTAGVMPPSRVAKLLAKSFYRDLAAAGFEPGQIIEAASEIIAQISGDVSRAKKRLAKDGS
jgi:GAF domain-containing protein